MTQPDRPETAADRLKRARISAGYKTAKEFAETMGVPQPTYALHESGERGLSLDVAKKYGEHLGVPALTILYGEDIRSLALTETERELLAKFNAMSPENKQAWLTLFGAKADDQPSGQLDTSKRYERKS